MGDTIKPCVKITHYERTIKTYFLSVFLALSTTKARATETSGGDQWNFIVAFPMIWAPEISGKVAGDCDNINIKIPFEDIVKDLNFGFMGDFYAIKGRWSYALKLTYLQTKEDTTTDELKGPTWGITIAPQRQIKTDLKLSANDFLVRYDLYKNILAYTGVRYFYTKIDMNIKPFGSGIITVDRHINIANDNLFYWIVGFSYSHWFSQLIGFGLSGDTAVAGDNDRDISANIVMFFRLSKLNNIWAGYRYLQIGNKTESDVGALDITFTQQGPMLGWAFTF